MNEMQHSQTVKSLFVMWSSSKKRWVKYFHHGQGRDYSTYGSDCPLMLENHL